MEFLRLRAQGGRRLPRVAATPIGADFAHRSRAARRVIESTARPITFDMAGGGGGRGAGASGGQLRWIDGEHWLASPRRPTPESEGRDGPPAVLRRESPGERPDKDQVAQATEPLNRSLAGPPSTWTQANEDSCSRKEQDFYYATFDGFTAVRLTTSAGGKQWPQFSPDGKAVAFAVITTCSWSTSPRKPSDA